MDVTPLIKEGQQIIQSYAAGVFRISGISYEHAVLTSPLETIGWNAPPFEALTIDDFSPLFEEADNIDVVLLGVGEKMQFMNPALRNALKEKGLSVDVMPTDAACRTYNVLMAEGRRVVAALLPTE
jgi:uncharacterized protein